MTKQKNDQTTPVKVGTRTYYVGSAQPARLITAGVLAVIFAVFFTLPLIRNNHAAALALTWDGGGVDNNWSTCENWTSDTCPSSGDALTFNSTSTKDSVVDVGFGGVITSINITTGYSGTVSLSRSLQTTSTFTHTTGTFTANAQTLDVDGSFVTTGGTFNASSGNMTLGSSVTIGASATFNHNSGNFTIDTVNGATIACNNAVFNLVTFAHTGSTKTISSGCNMPLGNNPTIGSGSASVTLSGTLSGTGTLSMVGALTLNSTSSLSGFTGYSTTSTLTLATVTVDFSSYTTFVVGSTVSISGATVLTLPNNADFNGAFTTSATTTLNMPSGSVFFAGNVTLTAGTTFNANSGTVTLDGSTATITCNGATFNLVTINNTGLKTIGSTCTLPLGANPTVAGSGQITMSGTFSGSGTFTRPGGGGQLAFSAGAVLSGFTGISAVNFGVQGATLDLSSYTSYQTSGTTSISSGSLTLPNGADLNSALSITGGTFNAPSGTMTVAGALTITGTPTFNANGGTITFDGTTTATLSCNSVTFNLVTFAHTTGTKTVNSNCSMPLGANPTVTGPVNLNGIFSGSGTLTMSSTFSMVSGSSLSGFDGLVTAIFNTATNMDFSSYTTFNIGSNFNMSGGTFTAPSGTFYLGGNFTITAGTYVHSNGTINLYAGAGTSTTLSCNSQTLYNVVFSHTSGTKTIQSTCTIPLGNNPTLGGVGSTTPVVVVQGTITGSGTLTMLGTAGGSGGLRFESTAVVSGFTGFNVQSFNVNGATLDLSGYTTVNIGATFTLASGTFTATQHTTSVEGTLNFTGGTYNHNNGTLRFSGTQTVALVCNNATFYKVEFTHTSSTKIVTNSCALPLGSDPTVTGNILNHGTLSGSGTLTTQDGTTLTMGSQGILTGFTNFNGYNFILAGSTVDASGYSSFTIRNDLTIQNGASFKAPNANTMYVAGDIVNQSGDGGLVVPGITGNNATTPDSSALSITGDLDIRVKANLTSWSRGVTQGLIAKFDATASNQRSYQLQVGSTGLLWFEGSATGATTPYSAIATAAVTGYDNTPVWVRMTRNATTGDVNYYTSTNGSSWTQLGSTVSATAGAIFDGTAPLVVAEKNNSISPASGTFYRAQVRNNLLDDGTGIVYDADFSSQANGTTSFTESSSNGATVTIQGSYAKIVGSGVGSFDANGGTVVLNGGDQQLSGDFTFYNLKKEVTTAATLTLQAGKTITVDGLLRLKGKGTQYLYLVSSSPGSQWYINRKGTSYMSKLAVKDSNHINNTLVACYSIDNGNNDGWAFNTDVCYSSVETSSTGNPAIDQEVVPEPEVNNEIDGQVDYGEAAADSSSSSRWYVVALSLIIASGGIWWLIAITRRRRDGGYDA